MSAILRKYGAATTVLFPLIDAGAQDFESTPVTFVAADTQISKDEATFANTTNTPAHEGNGIYSLALTATEMQAARIVITCIDAATKAWEDQAVLIETYGNASAEHAVDLDDSVRAGLTALPNVAAGSAGGVPTDTDANGAVRIVDGTGARELNTAAGAVDVGSIAAGAITAAAIAADAITNAKIATDAIGSDELAASAVAEIADGVWDEPIEDHDTQGNMGWATALQVYAGPMGPGIYVDDGAANTNTVVGTDGTDINPVSTFTAARTIADALGLRRYYLVGNAAAISLAATHEDWEFVGLPAPDSNVLDLGSQDVDRSRFYNLTVQGTQGGTERIYAQDCILQDVSGAGTTTLRIFAVRCGLPSAGDGIKLSNNDDHIFAFCYSMVAGNGTPVIDAQGGANVDVSFRHYSGGLEIQDLSATGTMSYESDGQLIVNANVNASATIVVRGNCSITNNSSAVLTVDAVLNKTEGEAWVDQALVTRGLDHLVSAAVAGADVVDDSIIAQLVSSAATADWDTFVNTTDALQAIRDVEPHGTTMRGTDNAALASVLGALADAAAAGDPTSADTVMQYVKQLVNLLAGTAGIATMPAAADPANGVNLFEMLRAAMGATFATATDSLEQLQADVVAVQADTDDIQTRLPAALVSGKMDSDMTSISGDATAADRLEGLMDGIIVAQVNDASATTTAFAADGFTEATDDHFNGRLITFITGALTGQQTDITDYDAAGGAQGSQQFTVTALTEAPANNDFFVIH